MCYICVPFCGRKLSDLTSDEFNCKHLRVFCITDESKYLKGDDREEKREKKRGREFTRITQAPVLLSKGRQRQAVQLIFTYNRTQHRQNKMVLFLSAHLSKGFEGDNVV